MKSIKKQFNMKNLFTLLLLVVSFLAVGQTNNTIEEIKYWKSIADSNDTVAYREYLQRYGENGLYYDEAITRITLLKTSGKQTQSNNAECFFYKRKENSDYVVVFFNDNEDEIAFISPSYHVIRENLAKSQDYYENYFMKIKYSELSYKLYKTEHIHPV